MVACNEALDDGEGWSFYLLNDSDVSLDSVVLRRMSEEDIPMLHDWLGRPHIVEWWGGDGAGRAALSRPRGHPLPGRSGTAQSARDPLL